MAATAVLLAPAPASADPPHVLFSTVFGPSLEHSNGNKIAVGRFNSLHAVHENNSHIRYSTSADGASWTPLTLLNPSGLASGYPAIAADGSGHVGVVWVGSPDLNGLGTLYYSYKAATSTTWTRASLNVSGGEPSLVASGATMYLAWTQGQRVRFAQFPTLAPPATATGEVIESTTCLATKFSKPAVTVISDPCKPAIARVGYLVAVDEQASSGSCQSGVTRVGPHVAQRNNLSSTWSPIFDGTRISSATNSSVESVSLSMSSNFTTGNTILAWSDVQDGAARTQLAHRQTASWVISPFNIQKQHVHVRVNGASNAPASEFRFAWTGGGGFDLFLSTLTFWNTATWPAAAPVWGTATSPENYGGLTGRPQSLFWKRCSAGQLSKTNLYFEVEQPCFSFAVATDYTTTSPCPSSTIGTVKACPQLAVLAATIMVGPRAAGTILDFADAGVVTEIGALSATVRTDAGKTVLVSWSGGAVVASSDTTLTLTAPRSAVAIRGDGFTIPVIETGHLLDYDSVQRPVSGLCLKEASEE